MDHSWPTAFCDWLVTVRVASGKHSAVSDRVALATASGLTVTGIVAMSEPHMFDTFMVTRWLPGVVKVCVKVSPFRIVPSLEVHTVTVLEGVLHSFRKIAASFWQIVCGGTGSATGLKLTASGVMM